MAVDASSDAGLVADFANTRDLRTFIPRGHPHRDGTTDLIGSPEDLHAWLVARDLIAESAVVSELDHARVLDLRANLRAALDRSRSADQHEAARAVTVPLQVEVDSREGPRLVSPDRGIDQAIGHITAAALRTTLTGELWRLRVCAAHDCNWVFYDKSKPGRGRYCAPDSCGNRVKTRAYRRRKADPNTRAG